VARIDNGWSFSQVKNYTENGQQTVNGLVVHIMDGTFEGSKSWFNNSESQASSHFGTNREGYAEQWVDTKDKAWTQAAGNSSWISVENEGNGGDELADGQLSRVAEILAWLHRVYAVPIQTANSPGERGLGWHGMGGSAWGNHPDCPGDRVRAQFPEILRRAAEMAGEKPKPTPPPVPSLKRELYFRRQSYFTGSDVKLLQSKLNGKGANLGADGSFGPKTLSAVKNFQQSRKLTVDGIVGPLTWAALWS
jgi:N-acetyl-anhydromuramyl-L-alanine amidase AmpD